MGSDIYNIAIDCLDRHVEEGRGEKRALVFIREAEGMLESRTFSFADLSVKTARFAHLLSNRGYCRGDRILIRIKNSPEFTIAFLGAVKGGFVPIPVSALLTESELGILEQDSGAVTTITQKDLATGWDHEAPVDFKVRPTSADDPAYWLYTSGTEGRPKGVIHAHRSIRAHDGRVKLWQNARETDLVFNTSSLNWSYALTCGLLDLWRNGVATLIYSGSLSGERIAEVVDRFGVTVFMSVPGIYRRLAGAGFSRPGGATTPLRQCFRHVRVCLSAGEKLSEEIRAQFKQETGIVIREGLGKTEHSVYLVQRAGEAVVPGSCGKPLPGTRVAVLREDLTECRPGEIGVIASHQSCGGLMLGGFEGEWFLSDDLAYRDGDGNFFFVGRCDDVITAGGYRISPLEVESVINRHPAVEESAVVGREIEAGKTIVSAFVVCRGGVSPPQKEDLVVHASRYLATYKIPREIVFTDRLPRTESGKIKRKDL